MSYRVLFFACLLGVFSSGVSAARPANTLQMYTEELPPLNYRDGSHVAGYSTAVATRILALAGFKGEFHLFPWKRAYSIVQEQPNTVLYTMARTEQREALFRWVGPLAQRRIYLYRLSRRPGIRLASLADVRPYRVVGLNGSAAANELSQRLPDVDLLLVGNEQQSLEMLLLDHADLVIMLDWAMQYHLAKLHQPGDRVTPALLLDDRYQYYFAVSKSTPVATVAKLQAAFDQLKASGELARLQEQYLHVKY
ncbi:substrate-binding periplasmic protein [Mangrovitalea sediminis]|uniref:substrate-binding periplasmic protein n=1 Tax=Mangrovitalea sediminis TaxID=1982043 RepID=UPI000BE4DEC0|nr:transporter substrate-binding domain-containing protein [Mangrovitalea sediminis]